MIIEQLRISYENKNREKIKSGHHFKGLDTCHLLAIFYVNCIFYYRVFNISISHNKNIGFMEGTMQLCHKFIQKHSIEIHKPYSHTEQLISLFLSLSFCVLQWFIWFSIIHYDNELKTSNGASVRGLWLDSISIEWNYYVLLWPSLKV